MSKKQRLSGNNDLANYPVWVYKHASICVALKFFLLSLYLIYWKLIHSEFHRGYTNENTYIIKSIYQLHVCIKA